MGRPQANDEQDAAEIARKRVPCAIPGQARHREKWRLALDMIDETLDWGLPRRPDVADSVYGDAPAFRQGLTDWGLTYAVAVSATSVHPAEVCPGPADLVGHRPPTGRDDLPRQDPHHHGGALARAVRRLAPRPPQTAGNPTATMRSRFLALHVRPANRNIPRNHDGSFPECWLLAEWPTGQPEPADYWLSTLPAGIRLRVLVKIAKIRWRIERDGLGLDHFEGRSWAGWHRHVTLTSVAQAICTQLRRTQKPLRRPDSLHRPAPPPTITHRLQSFTNSRSVTSDLTCFFEDWPLSGHLTILQHMWS